MTEPPATDDEARILELEKQNAWLTERVRQLTAVVQQVQATVVGVA